MHPEVIRLQAHLEKVVADAQGARNSRSWQALAGFHRLEQQAIIALSELTVKAAPPVDPFDTYSDADLEEVLLECVQDIPDATWAKMLMRRKGLK